MIGRRVQIPAHTDSWMTGDRYGEIVAVKARRVPGDPTSKRMTVYVHMDRSGRTLRFDADLLDTYGTYV